MSSISSVTTPNPFQAANRPDFKKIKADFSNLATALQSGKTSDAQAAFAALQNDDPRVAAAVKQGSSATSAAGTALNQLAAALQSGDLAGAQSAFASLQQARQGHHHHHDADGDDAATPPSTASGPSVGGLNATA